jgi:hypothetical protein
VCFWFVQQKERGLMAEEQAQANGVDELMLAVGKCLTV